MTLDPQLLDRLRQETALVRTLSDRTLGKRLLSVAVICTVLGWGGQFGIAAVVVLCIGAIEAIAAAEYRALPDRAADIEPAAILRLWSINTFSTVLYVIPALALATSANAAYLAISLIWMGGVYIHIITAHAPTPIYGKVVLAPALVAGLAVVALIAHQPVHPPDAAERALIFVAVAVFIFNIFESLAAQTHAQAQLARARAEAEARLSALESALDARSTAERRFEDIAALSQDWFWETDRTGRLSYLGAGFATALGLRAEALMGLNPTEMGALLSDRQQGGWAQVAERIAAQQPFEGVVVAINHPDPGPTDGRIWLRLSGTPFRDAAGAWAGFRGVCTDVTPFMAATERAEAANRAKSQFLAVMSHELRTPLTAVLGMAELLRDRMDDREGHGMLDTIHDAGAGLLAVLDDILDLARIEAGKLGIEPEPFSPADLARRTEALFGPRAAAAGLTLTVAVAPGLALPRLGDPKRILQILNNLIGNAVKFTHQGGIRVTLAPEGADTLRLTVEDDGIGMTPEQQARVFDEFEQAEQATSRRYGGTGLGLSIVRKLAGLMGGQVTLDSAPGRGSRFEVRLPCPPAPAADRPRPAVAQPVLAGLRVLVADDNAVNRRILAAMLGHDGCTVTLADGGQAALDHYRDGGFDMILLDISMPGLDGPATLAAMRALDATRGRPGPPALAVTAHAMPHQIEGFLAAGFAGHLPKPFTRASLRAAIAAAGPGLVPA